MHVVRPTKSFFSRQVEAKWAWIEKLRERESLDYLLIHNLRQTTTSASTFQFPLTCVLYSSAQTAYGFVVTCRWVEHTVNKCKVLWNLLPKIVIQMVILQRGTMTLQFLIKSSPFKKSLIGSLHLLCACLLYTSSKIKKNDALQSTSSPADKISGRFWRRIKNPETSDTIKWRK